MEILHMYREDVTEMVYREDFFPTRILAGC